MLGPLCILAALSSAGWFLFRIPVFLKTIFESAEEAENITLVVVSVAAGVIGIGFAYVMYVLRPGLADSVARGFGGLYKLVYNKYFVDEMYDATVVKPVVSGSTSVLWRGVDAGLIDGAVNGIGTQARGIGGVLKLLQSGNIR